MNASNPAPRTTIDDIRKTAAAELDALKSDGFQLDFIAAADLPIRNVIELMTKFDAACRSVLAIPDLPREEVRVRLTQIASETHQAIIRIVDGMRYGKQAAEIETILYRVPEEAKGGDALLDFLRQTEVRGVLRQKTAAEVAAIYREAIDAGNHFIVRCLESDPLRSLVPPEVVEDGRRRRAERDNPELSRRLHDIRRKQRALNGVVTAAGRMLDVPSPSSAGLATDTV
jgi:hypothetical protein